MLDSLSFEETSTRIKGLRVFDLVGSPTMARLMFEWCREMKKPILDIQWWNGTAVAFHQTPAIHMRDKIVGTVRVGFLADQADEIVSGWSKSRYLKVTQETHPAIPNFID